MTTARRLPSWLKAKMPGSKNYIEVNNLVKNKLEPKTIIGEGTIIRSNFSIHLKENYYFN